MKHIKLFESNIRHNRVIPRDFFNEAKLLKCMGFLALRILDNQLPEGIKIEIDENGQPFEIGMLQDGALFVMNYPVTVNGERVIMKTTYNSKDNFPLYCQVGYDEYLVFNEKGEFDQEFIDFFSNMS